jgi:hypothetical protein
VDSPRRRGLLLRRERKRARDEGDTLSLFLKTSILGFHLVMSFHMRDVGSIVDRDDETAVSV